MRNLVLLFLILSLDLCAQRYKIEGTIRDADNNMSLPLTSIIVVETQTGTTSDDNGHFKLSLEAGNYTLRINYLGYESKQVSIKLNKNLQKVFYLTPSVYTTQEVTIGGVRTDKNVQQSRMSVVKISPKTLKSIPAFMGEIDILKTIQLMPGVQSGGEGSTGFYVRGGGPDQNLILLDQSTIYNASHLFGFFSVFNADAIEDVELFKGGMPAQYGGRLSSVLDIGLATGNKEKIKASGGIGTISTRLTLQGPILKNKASFIVSGRRTYIDALVMPFIKEDSPFKGSGYFFYDLNAKLDYKINDNNNIFLSGYYGQDKFSFVQQEDDLSLEMPWGNGMASFRWNHLFSSKSFVDISLRMSDYQFSTNTSMTADYETGEKSSLAQYSGIRDYSASSSFTYIPSTKHIIKYGAGYTLHQFTPNTLKSDMEGLENIGEGVRQHAHEVAVYSGDDWKINQRITLYGGLRAALFNQVGPFTRYVKDPSRQYNTDTIYYHQGQSIARYWSIEPRLSLKISAGKDASFKASYMRNKQFIHLASLSASTLPTDLWVSSTDRVNPQQGQQFVLGYFKNFNDNMYESSIEAYYKTMNNMLEYADGSLPGDEINDNVDNYFVFGSGRSYGIEFFLRKNVGRFTGWIGYTYSNTDRQFDDIDKGKRFPAKYDRPHDLSITGNYQINKTWDIAMVFVYTSGNTTTLPVSRYVLNGRIRDEYGPRNWYRLDPYHRMDLSVNYHFDLNNKIKSTINFSIYNLYNRKNPYFVYFDTEGDIADNTFHLQAKQVSLFPILPSLTWNFNF